MGYIDDVIKSTGEEKATLKKVTEENVNKWGDAETSVEEETISAVFEVLSAESNEVQEGNFESGDLQAYLPLWVDNVNEGDVLVYQGTEYKVDEVVKQEIGREGHYEVRAGQI